MALIKTSGFEELDKELDRLADATEELNGEQDIPLDDLLVPEFIQEHSSFKTFDEMLKAGGFSMETEEDYDAIPDEVLDLHVSKTTDFTSWEQMLEEALSEYLSRKLGF